MAERNYKPRSLVARPDQPLIGIFRENDGRESVEYTIDDSTDEASASQILKDALAVIGAWSDLDWEAMEQALDRIRHESIPTPPIEL
jgi:hypothetical protein